MRDKMDRNGLIVPPEFDNISKYLESGTMTQITDNLKKVSDKIEGDTEGIIIRKLIVWLNTNTKRLNNPKDERKFKRTAEEIMLSGERTGWCDSATLYTALARSKGIPTMQIITFSKKWAEGLSKGESKAATKGHFFAASYIKDVHENSSWVIIDPDQNVQDIGRVRITQLDTNNRNIFNDYYAFAYVKDYRDVAIDGIKINSKNNMAIIQEKAYRKCSREIFMNNDEYER